MGVGAGLYMYVVVVQKFTFAISSPDEFLLYQWKRRSQSESVCLFYNYDCQNHPTRASATIYSPCYSPWLHGPALVAWSSGRDVVVNLELTWVGLKKAWIRWGPDPPCKGAIFWGKVTPGHGRRHSAMSCAKTAEPIEMPFGLWTRVGPRKHVDHGKRLSSYPWGSRSPMRRSNF